jgi:mRNA interferase MazF
VAEVTTNLAERGDPAFLFIDLSTPDGRATGLVSDSLVSCVLLASVSAELVNPVIGRLSPALVRQLDDCLKAALGLP